MKQRKLKAAVFLNQFPTLSETFILNQIVGLIDADIEIQIFPLEKKNDKKIHPLVKKYQLLDKICCFSIPQNRWARWLKFILLFFFALFKEPSSLRIFSSKLKVDKRTKLELFFRSLAVKDKEFDIIHCHFGPNGKQAVLLKELGLIRGKIITSFHGYDFSAYIKSRGKDAYHQLFYQAELLTANSNFTKKKIEALGCPSSKIVKLSECLKIKDFLFHPKKLKPKEKIKILTVARLVEKKGLEHSIKAIARVLKKHPNLEYKIAGGGPLADRLGNLIQKLGVEKEIILLGGQDQNQIQKLYHLSHLFVLASLTDKSGDQEGQGLVLQEAQACGLPVISTLHNGIPEGVLNGKSGFLVPEGDVGALAEKLTYLITHPQIWTKMGRAGRKFVEKKYDVGRLSERLIKIYYQLVNQ